MKSPCCVVAVAAVAVLTAATVNGQEAPAGPLLQPKSYEHPQMVATGPP